MPTARTPRWPAELAGQIQELAIFGDVVDNAIFGIAIADMRKPDEPLIYVNDAFTTITGYGRELAVGFNCRFLQGPDTDSQELKRLRAALRSGKPYSGELINYRADGRRFWNRLTLYPVFGSSDQRPDDYVGNQVDITELRQPSSGSANDTARLSAELEAARAALGQAERFSEGLRRHLVAAADAAPEAEAFLIAEQEAHRRLQDALEQLNRQLSESGAL